jgi:hypothetical protein
VCSGCGHQLKVQRAGFTVQRVAFWAGLSLVGIVVAFFGSAVISGVIAAKDLDSLYVTEPLYLELVDGQLPPAGTLTERVSPGTRVRRFPDPPRTLTLASGAIVRLTDQVDRSQLIRAGRRLTFINVDREREIADIQDVLLQSRLLVLTGVGGCGKTHRSLRAAAGLAPLLLMASGSFSSRHSWTQPSCLASHQNARGPSSVKPHCSHALK